MFPILSYLNFSQHRHHRITGLSFAVKLAVKLGTVTNGGPLSDLQTSDSHLFFPSFKPYTTQNSLISQGQTSIPAKAINSACFREIIVDRVPISIGKKAAKKSAFLVIFLLTIFDNMLKYAYVSYQANIIRQ